MKQTTGWALWKEPSIAAPLYLSGTMHHIAADQMAAGGFFIHPFEGNTGYLIEGTPALYANQPLDFLPTDIYGITKSDGYDTYTQKLSALIKKLSPAGISKVVLSRRWVAPYASLPPAQAYQTFLAVAQAYPKCMVALVSTQAMGTWLTATPEVLCAQTGGNLTTMALAGTHHTNATTAWTLKEQEEQKAVSAYIHDTLQSLGLTILKSKGPYSSQAGNLVHLRTDFEAKGTATLLDTARALHPTPAVCGLPSEEAKRLIAAYESTPRGLYAGFLGYLPTVVSDDATLYVHLRCACISEPHPILFAGGGILPASDPAEEWEETQAKLQVLQPFIAQRATLKI